MHFVLSLNSLNSFSELSVFGRNKKTPAQIIALADLRARDGIHFKFLTRVEFYRQTR